MNSQTFGTSLIYVVMIRNFYDAALIVELLIPSGVIDVHELTITQHYIITILAPLDGLLHFKPRGRRDHDIIFTIRIHLLKELQGLMILPKSQSHITALILNTDMFEGTFIT